MKKQLVILVSLSAFYACKKDSKKDPEPATPPATVESYTSLSDFYSRNGVPKQTFHINAGTGGSFITPQGTTVNIPANAFSPASENITIEFKDIYKKSDMLLTDMGTSMIDGTPLKSAGEFFIKALNSNNTELNLNPGAKIDILQPLIEPLDTAMGPFVEIRDTIAKTDGWYTSPNSKLLRESSNYVFSLYQFQNPVKNGTWANSDNPSFFSALSQTTLTINPKQPGFLHDVFLVFKSVNSMVHVYKKGSDYPYFFAPIGLECTVVVIALKDGRLYSSFTPIKISANQTVDFDLTETTTEEFKTSLRALD